MISSVIAALGQTLGAVSGIKAIHITPPMSLNSADIPAIVIMHTGGEYNWHAIGLARRVTRYDVVLVVEAVAANRMPEKVAMAHSLYDAIVDALLDDPTLGGAVDQMSYVRDNNGYQVTTWAGMDFFGYTLSLEAIEK